MVKRIAIFADGIWPDTIGGMQKHTHYLIHYLVINGYKVDVYYPANDNKSVIDSFSFDDALNIHFYKISQPRFRFRFPGHYIAESWLLSKKIYRKYKMNQPCDAVYAQGFTAWFAVYKGLKLASNLHGLEMYQKAFGLKSKLSQILLRMPASVIIKKSHLSISLGGQLTAILKRKGAHQVAETPIGIGEEWLQTNTRSSGPTEFIFVGRNEKRKGLDLLFSILEGNPAPECKFHFIGLQQPGNFELKNCTFYGEEKNPDVIRNILSKCDVLLCPSIAEGMPTVILEAMASGLAIIATDTGATALLTDDTNGRLLTPGNADELSKAIKEFSGMPREILQSKKEASYQKVSRQYIWPVSIRATIAALQQL